MPILKKGDTVGLISCSDGLRQKETPTLKKLKEKLSTLGLTTVEAKNIFRNAQSPFSGTPQERASEFMRLVSHPKVKAIFDVSGGDSANQILPYLDFDMIRDRAVPFIGISDLSVINNAIYARTSLPAYHYRIKNLAGSFSEEQAELFNSFFMDSRQTEPFTLHWLRGRKMAGTVIGGNIRCFLKLAGTRYFPDPKDKILFLEALGGKAARMASLLAQLEQLSVFDKCAGVLLGTFTEMQANNDRPIIEDLVLEITERHALPVAKTEQLGHGEDARCLAIGHPLTLGM
ncbi:LD-carboxypeptidase [Sporolactobacillus sp. CPB3-1]|uniref:LD-carboxypeptidase n=1 Tax=Sporolactobacillus mangiferae TaxID=2940498 RepID=A0ABT0MB16_9BACL|nr:LD-carboxypeptidase [Sporolactobacillus mangiferae]MCL1632058.1 LD-carboxypeptidase [Sporolactobacillus mangiferae]